MPTSTTTLRIKLGKAVRRLRAAAGFSQEGFAAACKLHRTYIGALERGEKNTTIDTIDRLAKTLKITPFDLFREAEKEL